MKSSPQSLSGLFPFLRPYRWPIAFAGVFLLLAAGTTLAFPWALRVLIDEGLVQGASTEVLAWKFFELFLVAAALALFSAARFYTVSWLGERLTADLRNAVYSHVLRQSPTFFETTQSGEVLSRLTSDATLIQTVVGSSLSMGLRNLVMGVGAMVMLVWTNPWLMLQVLGVLAVVVFPSVYLGRRVRRLSRASQDRVADSSALASEVLNAISVVQSYTAELREAVRFNASNAQALTTSLRRVRARSLLVGFIIMASSVVGWVLTFEQLPAAFVDFAKTTLGEPWMIILSMNLIMLAIGMFIDLPAAVLLLTPMFVPLAGAIGMDTVQLGIMMIINLSIGLYHPPVGTTLFITSSIAKVRMGQVVLELIPFYAVAFAVLMLFSFVPAMTIRM